MPNLILIPTDFERRLIEPKLQFDDSRWLVRTVGFGVVASAIGAANALHDCQPQRVILAGIAGLFAEHRSDSINIGDVVCFRSVMLDGIGIGQGDDFVDARSLGWDDPATESLSLSIENVSRGHDVIVDGLLTVCAASADQADADRRSERFPAAVAEDMEGFAVASACRQADVPLTILRGLSNIVGDRNKQNWQLESSTTGLARHLQPLLELPE